MHCTALLLYETYQHNLPTKFLVDSKLCFRKQVVDERTGIRMTIWSTFVEHNMLQVYLGKALFIQSELLGQFRLISDRASDVSGGRICLTQNAYAEL